MAEFYYHPILLFIWGICWGSFFNVVLYRYPLGKSVVHPGSACPNCRHAIAFYDNIPILSWLILRGKCRFCKVPISPRYILFEALFGLLSALPYFIHPNHWQLGLLLGTAFLAATPALWLLVKHHRAPWYLLLAALIAILGYLVQLSRI